MEDLWKTWFVCFCLRARVTPHQKMALLAQTIAYVSFQTEDYVSFLTNNDTIWF